MDDATRRKTDGVGTANNPDRGSPAPEVPRPKGPTGEEALASCPEEGQLPPQPPTSTTAARQRHHDRLRNRLLRKKILTPIILAVIGVALFLLAIVLYPPSGELSAPPYTSLQFKSTFAIRAISYEVSQVSPSIAEIDVWAELNTLHSPAKAPPPELDVILPSGISFQTCPESSCAPETSGNFAFSWNYLTFEPAPSFTVQSDKVGVASATFRVRAHNFGIAFNDVTATAAIPQLRYTGPGSPTLVTQYDNFPSVSSYDWSAFPTEFAYRTLVAWNESVAGGATPGRVATGINHGNQEGDSNKTFFAGALLGLAGGAILSAVQEALHAND